MIRSQRINHFRVALDAIHRSNNPHLSRECVDALFLVQFIMADDRGSKPVMRHSAADEVIE
jgi:hypothetical protein